MPALARSVSVCSTLFLLVAALGATPVARAQVCEGPIRLSSQAQVDAFDCTEVTSDLTVSGPDVENLDGLASLTSVRGSLDIFVNSELTDLTGLGGLASVGGTLALRGNGALTDLAGLGGITSVGGSLRISDNDALTHLDALASVSSVGGDLRIEGNHALADLTGLGGITSVGGALDIGDNGALTDLDALARVSSVGGALRVEFNGVLGACTVGLYDLLTSGVIGGPILVYDNAPGCNSVEEILNAVGAEDVAPPLVTDLAAPYPNPTAGAATVAYTLAEPADVRLTVYDVLGRRVRTLVEGPGAVGAHEVALAALPAGVYVARLDVGDRSWTQRVTVVR